MNAATVLCIQAYKAVTTCLLQYCCNVVTHSLSLCHIFVTLPQYTIVMRKNTPHDYD